MTVTCFMPKRYLTERDDEPDAGYFSIGWIQDAKKELIRGMGYADVIAGIRKGQLRFEILVSGKRPPVDELWNQYLVASPAVADKLKKQFGRQIEYIETQAVDDETDECFDMVLLKPVLEAKCFIKAKVVKSSNRSRLPDDCITTGRSGTPKTYVLSQPVLGNADIALVSNAPEPILVLSERFKDAILATIPRPVRHLRHIDFRSYHLLDERPASATRKATRRPSPKAGSKARPKRAKTVKKK